MSEKMPAESGDDCEVPSTATAAMSGSAAHGR
jgi:hypothetical protein